MFRLHDDLPAQTYEPIQYKLDKAMYLANQMKEDRDLTFDFQSKEQKQILKREKQIRDKENYDQIQNQRNLPHAKAKTYR